MTCIVGLVHVDKVYIAGDSAGLAGWGLTVRKDKKVFRNGDFLIGFTSSFRMGDLLKYSFIPPEYDASVNVDRYMATKFIDALRECLKIGGYAQKVSDRESAGTFLVGFRGRLFEIDDDYQVGEALCEYVACGCGQEVAVGVLHATQNMPLEPRKRLEMALQAAEYHNGGVRSPFVIEVLS